MGPADVTRWFGVVNTVDDLIPSYGLCVPTGDPPDANGNLPVKKPAAGALSPLIAVGETGVPPSSVSGVGKGTFDPPFVAYDPTDPTAPAAGEAWGAVAGSWYAGRGGAGFTVVNTGADGLVNVVRETTGGDSGWFFARIDSGSDAAGYAFTQVALTGPNTWAEPASPVTGTGYRAPSAATGSGYPPDIPAGQTVLARRAVSYTPGEDDPDPAYELTPWGGMTAVTVMVDGSFDPDTCLYTAVKKTLWVRDGWIDPDS